jgi:hypothetical protein
MIDLESIEIHNDTDNKSDKSDKSNKSNKSNKPSKKLTKLKKSNILESDQQDNLSSESDKINIDNINIGYPKTTDPNLQQKIYSKREFYYYKLPDRPNLSNYKEIQEYRKKICEPSGELLEHQAMLSNFINPDTPYKGVLIFHGTGTGKTCVGVAIGEKFKQQVQRYGTQIYVLVPGPLLKENWKNSFIQCTGDTYLRTHENLLFLNDFTHHT